MQQLLDAGLVPVDDAAAALGMEPKRLIGFILRDSIRDPIGGWLPDAGMAVYGWSCRHIADTSSAAGPCTCHHRGPDPMRQGDPRCPIHGASDEAGAVK